MITATPRKNARRTGGGSMIATPFVLRRPEYQRASAEIVRLLSSLHCCGAGPVATLQIRASLMFAMRNSTIVSAHLTIPLSFERILAWTRKTCQPRLKLSMLSANFFPPPGCWRINTVTGMHRRACSRRLQI